MQSEPAENPSFALDFLALGALVHRLDPGTLPFHRATQCSIHVSGGEFNVAANLSECFRLKTGIASALVDYPIGELVAGRVRALGVTPFYKHFEHNGVSGPNMATVYSDRGYGVRPPVVFYNRANEAAAQLEPGDFDWDAIFARGVRWFHSGGIFASLSESTGELIIEAMRAAKAAGARISFDLNFREKLWNVWGGAERAQRVLSRIVEHVDVLFGDAERSLGVLGPARPPAARFEARHFFGTVDALRARYPALRAVATTRRDELSTNRHAFSALAWVEGQSLETPSVELDIYDRVGAGDGFAAGFVYGLLAGEAPESALRLGWAHGALLTTYPGDTSMATLAQVRALARGGSAGIQR